MKFHIVQLGERIDDILFLYNLERDELIERNRHIRSWERLIPGTKLKIPVITEEIDQEVISMEPFIEDYYPKTPTYDVPSDEISASLDIKEKAVEKEELNNQSSYEKAQPTEDISSDRDNIAKEPSAENVEHQEVKEHLNIQEHQEEKEALNAPDNITTKEQEKKEGYEQLHLSKRQTTPQYIYVAPYPYYNPPLYFYPVFYSPNYPQKK